MRDFIDCLAIWLGPGIRRALYRLPFLQRPAQPEPVLPVPLLRKPVRLSAPLPLHVRVRRLTHNAENRYSIRPYQLRQEWSDQLRRERRTAAALASLGIDYDADLVAALNSGALTYDNHPVRTLCQNGAHA
ncbi:hypothetical protein HUT18_18240 [Streptomyces sp. NA04227]|uniref:hypothetical protein n=1 Tax=Streptomyces sp. NA04227 TaxID=2742136 RepID=UPI00158FC4BA|nr:hypothetical protein [Streptomyces sp. NA04227]QKW08029.1 hypothetical protein HUT18_18240 [Streptomyces sp. NA04227]